MTPDHLHPLLRSMKTSFLTLVTLPLFVITNAGRKAKSLKREMTLVRSLIFSLLLLAALSPIRMFAAPPPGIPDGWSDGYVYANGIRIHYYHATSNPGKPVILMVHGVTDNGLCWTTLTWKFQNDYDIYMLDTRGHGLSDPFTTADNGDTLIKDVVDVVHAMKFEKPILMGHSMGAATVMRVGAEYPELAKAIIMLDPLIGRGGFGGGALGGRGPRSPASGTNTPARTPERSAATVQNGERRSPTASSERPAASQDHLSVNMFGSPETLVAQNNYNFEDLVATGHRQNPKWDMVDCQYWALSKKQFHGAYQSQGSEAMTGAMRIGDSLAKITVPAIILKADAPSEVRKANEEIVKDLTNVKLVHIDGAAHNLHHDQLKKTEEVLRKFLSTLQSPQ